MRETVAKGRLPGCSGALGQSTIQLSSPLEDGASAQQAAGSMLGTQGHNTQHVASNTPHLGPHTTCHILHAQTQPQSAKQCTTNVSGDVPARLHMQEENNRLRIPSGHRTPTPHPHSQSHAASRWHRGITSASHFIFLGEQQHHYTHIHIHVHKDMLCMHTHCGTRIYAHSRHNSCLNRSLAHAFEPAKLHSGLEEHTTGP